MASSYVLPASSITHSHHHHGHSHSHSPSRPYPINTPRSLKQERSNASLHSYSYSESHSNHVHSHEHSHSHSHSHEREVSPYLPTPPTSTGPPAVAFEKLPYESSPAISVLSSYEPPLNNVNVLPHDHDHDHHAHTKTVITDPRSKFTTFIIPFVLRWPLIHTIIAEKDSRRIFYFMR